ncbi:MAG: hypothetical protein R3D00_07905 [Bacteroidia bacterium]
MKKGEKSKSIVFTKTTIPMPFSQLLKFSKIYQDYGLGAAKNFYLLVSLISLGQTVNLYKLKDHVSSVLGKTHTDVQSHYQRLIRFLKTGVSRKNFCTTSCATIWGCCVRGASDADP